jgi:hypothetical protein
MRLDIDFEIEVGETEKHRVAFHWGQLFGQVRITVDGVEVVQENKALRFRSSPVRTFAITVGDQEPHAVVFEKTNKRVVGGARRQSCRALVDGELVGQY